MMDRRGFVLKAAASVGGAAAFAELGFAGMAEVTYGRIGLASGAFAAFAPTRSGEIAGPIDLFRVCSAPPGNDREEALSPLGRFSDEASALAS